MCSIMHCYWCDRVVMSLLTTATIGLWSVITSTSSVKQYCWNLSRPCSMPRASHSMLLYHCSILDKVVLKNAMKHNAVLCGTFSCLQFMPSLTCKRPAPRPIPEVSASRYRALMCHRISCMHLAWLHSWLCCITPDTYHFITILSSFM